MATRLTSGFLKSAMVAFLMPEQAHSEVFTVEAGSIDWPDSLNDDYFIRIVT